MVAIIVPDDLWGSGAGMGNRSGGVNGSADARIGAAEHRAAELDGAEFGVSEVLSGGSRFFKPAVISDIEDHLWSIGFQKGVKQSRDGVFKTDCGNGTNQRAIGSGDLERCGFGASGERPAIGDACLLFVDRFEQGDRFNKGNGFSEENQVVFVVGLKVVLGGKCGETIPCFAMFADDKLLVRSVVCLHFIDSVNELKGAVGADF